MDKLSSKVWALSWSVEERSEELGALLEAHPPEKGGVNVNLQDRQQARTPLHGAAHRGHTASARLLIDAQASIEARDLDGRTPLALASQEGRSDCIEVLIENKADIYAPDTAG
jgi:ankyrin repeat protein